MLVAMAVVAAIGLGVAPEMVTKFVATASVSASARMWFPDVVLGATVLAMPNTEIVAYAKPRVSKVDVI
jgi:formate-dependent phosphoribosylglycinamide formyltransferase (GAR transformylase)